MSQSHLLEQLPQKDNQGDQCSIHSKPLELVCQEDGEYICVNYALFGNHKFHNYKQIDEYAKEMEQTFYDITTMYEIVKEMRTKIEQKAFSKEFETQLLQSKDAKLQSIDIKFNELFNELMLMKEEIKSRISNNYNLQYDDIINFLNCIYFSIFSLSLIILNLKIKFIFFVVAKEKQSQNLLNQQIRQINGFNKQEMNQTISLLKNVKIKNEYWVQKSQVIANNMVPG